MGFSRCFSAARLANCRLNTRRDAWRPTGDIWLAGRFTRAARQAGGALKRLPEGSTLRRGVVNRHGDISRAGPAASTPASGGVQVSGSGHIDLHSTTAGFIEEKKCP